MSELTKLQRAAMETSSKASYQFWLTCVQGLIARSSEASAYI